MSKVDDELTRRLRGAERPVDGEDLFEGLARRRSHRERVRRTQTAVLAFVVLVATAGGFFFLRHAFDADGRDIGGQRTESVGNGEIVFSGIGAEGHLQLFVARPDGSDVRALTASGPFDDLNPAVSPDGSTVVFQRGFEGAGFAIASVPITGGQVRELTDRAVVLEPAWSPDGAMIAFSGSFGDDAFGLWVMDADGSDPRPIAGNGSFDAISPSWSPDGSRIAFVGFDDGDDTQTEIYSITPDGDGLVQVTDTPGLREVSPAWSPDGRTIAFAQSGDDIEGSEIRTVHPDGGAPSLVERTDFLMLDQLTWAPDGTALLASFNGWVHLVDIRTGGFVRLVEGTTAAWQPIREIPGPEGSTPPEPSVTTEPELAGGRDIGLGFPVCQVSKLAAQFDGKGAQDTAVVATRLDVDGRCPSVVDEAQAYVGIDLDHDGSVDTAYGPISCEAYYCRVFAAPDLNGDGDRHELLVVESAGSVVGLGVYSLEDIGSPPSETTAILRIEIGDSDYRERGFVTGEPARLFIGGDEGWSYRMRCEDQGGNRFLYMSRAYHAIDESGPWTVDETTLYYANHRLNVFDARESELSMSDDPLGPQPQDLCGTSIPQV